MIRRDEVPLKDKFNIKLTKYAFYEPIFGCDSDIFIGNQSNTNVGSYSNFVHLYHLPNGYRQRG